MNYLFGAKPQQQQQSYNQYYNQQKQPIQYSGTPPQMENLQKKVILD